MGTKIMGTVLGMGPGTLCVAAFMLKKTILFRSSVSSLGSLKSAGLSNNDNHVIAMSDVYEALRQLKFRKSCAPDGIQVEAINMLQRYWQHILRYCYLSLLF